MMEVVIVDDGNRLTVYELVERVIPCIIAKHYSENYIQGFRSTFRNLLAYCNKNEKKYFTAELAQQFMLDCYGVQPGTVERRCSRVHRAMDLRLGFIGDEFGTARRVFTNRLPGDTAWRNGRPPKATVEAVA